MSAMSVLTITDVPDEIVAELARRAAVHGGSLEDEARRVLARTVPSLPKFTTEENQAFAQHLMSFPEVAPEDAWIFDRHDPRNARPERPPADFSD